MKTRECVKKKVSVEQAGADLNDLATGLRAQRMTIAGKDYPLGEQVKSKWKARIKEGQVVLELSLTIPLRSDGTSMDTSIRSAPSDRAGRKPPLPPVPAERKAQVKRIKKNLALLWKTTRKRVLADGMLTPAEYADLLQAFDDFSELADPVWRERWLESRRIVAAGLDPISSGTTRAGQAIDAVNRMVRECHKRFR